LFELVLDLLVLEFLLPFNKEKGEDLDEDLDEDDVDANDDG